MPPAITLTGRVAPARLSVRGVLADLQWLEWLALAVLFLMFWYQLVGVPNFSREGGDETEVVSPLNRIILLGLLGMCAPLLVQRRREALRLLATIWPMLVMFAYFGASTQWSLDEAASMRRFIAAVVQLVIYLSVVATVRRSALLHVTAVAACVLMLLLDAAVGAAMPGFAFMYDGFAGIHSQKNQTGLLYMFACLVTGTSVFLFARTRDRLIVGGLAAAMFGILVISRSETSITMVFMCAVLGPLFYAMRKLSANTVRSLVAIPLFSAVFGLFMYFVVCAVGGKDPFRPLVGVTFSQRTDLWDFLLSEIQKRPLFGAGFGSFWAIDPSVQPSLKLDMWFAAGAHINEGHNGYLDMLATNGFIGLALGLIVLFRTLSRAIGAAGGTKPASLAWRDGSLARPTAFFYLLLLVAYLIHNNMESEFFSASFLGWYFVLVTLEIEKWRLQNQEEVRLGRIVLIPRRRLRPPGREGLARDMPSSARPG